jgi:23S rRNA (guanosine2251-2'-O)-methyltransferase
MPREVYVMLDNVRSALNVGSIFRTSDGAGVAKILLVGYTPTPIDRFGRTQAEIKKTSLGASDTMSWEQLTDEGAQATLTHLKSKGFHIVAVEQSSKSIPLYDFHPQNYQKICYIFGNEIDGVNKTLMELSDTILEIPMAGVKESLNVGVSVGIVLFNL